MRKAVLASIAALGVIFLLTSCSYSIISGAAGSKIPPDETEADIIELIPRAAETTAKASASTPELVAEQDVEYLEIKGEYLELWKRNPELTGRIYIENTAVDHYVFFSGDNEYYLNHDIDGNEYKYGCVFMDEINHGVLLDKNTILHGHNFDDGYVFNDVVKYKKQQFYEEHKTVRFDTLYHDYTWEVFAAYTVTVEEYFIKIAFGSDEEFYDYVDDIISRSVIKSDYKPRKTDMLLTLHTCSYEFKDAHTLVFAYLKDKR